MPRRVDLKCLCRASCFADCVMVYFRIQFLVLEREETIENLGMVEPPIQDTFQHNRLKTVVFHRAGVGSTSE